MLLNHYSAEPLGTVRPVAHQRSSHKPVGLWLSVGTQWKDWCEYEGFRTHALKHVTQLPLPEGTLVLDTLNGLRWFTMQYGADQDGDTIDWARVAERHPAILVLAKTIKKRGGRLPSWARSWDIDSACVWR